MRKIIIYTVFLATFTVLMAWCVGSGWYWCLILLPVVAWLFWRLIHIHARMLSEFNELVETVRYRDFSRWFDTKKGHAYLRQMHIGFNEICSVIIAVNREKELQYQYLQKIIEMVDTGILCYRIDTGDVLWINTSLKSLLNIPVLRNFNKLQQRNQPLYESLMQMGRERNAIVQITRDDVCSKVLVAAGTFVLQEEQYRLLAFQNINEALDEAETKAWQRLLHVMTHEIMNSVAPIASLGGSIKNLISRMNDGTTSRESVLLDIEMGVDTIMYRSEGLLSFAETYRNLSRITELNIGCMQVSKLFDHISQLMLPSLTQKNIELAVFLKDPLMQFEADRSLVEQVIINLIINAVEALKGRPAPHIILSAQFNSAHRPVIKVSDNGCGIPSEVVSKIFIPFFSTRKNGTGIGLSLCKQIMLLHHGNLQVYTVDGKGSCFSLLF